MSFRTTMYQMVEVAIGRVGGMPTAFQRTPFEQQPQLQSYVEQQTVYIHKIESYSAEMMVNSPISGLPTATPTQIQGATLTLVTTGVERIRQLPISDLVNLQPSQAAFTPWSWNGLLTRDLYSIDFGKSYITNVIDLSAATPFAFLFGFHYSYQPDPMWDNVFDTNQPRF